MHVMLVEDSPTFARLVQEMLKEAAVPHLTVDWQSSLAAALPRVAEDNLDVVLLDLGLPDSHGLDTLVRAREGAPHVPIVVLTGMDDQEQAAQALQLGAQDYLIKGSATRSKTCCASRCMSCGFKSDTLSRAIHYAIEESRTEEMESFTYSVSPRPQRAAAYAGSVQPLLDRRTTPARWMSRAATTSAGWRMPALASKT